MSGGHSGMAKTLSKICGKYYWSTITADITKHLKDCHSYLVMKSSRKKADRFVAPYTNTSQAILKNNLKLFRATASIR